MVDYSAAEAEGQPMYRTPLGPALIANGQYLSLASGPRSCDTASSRSRERNCEQVGADKGLIFRD